MIRRHNGYEIRNKDGLYWSDTNGWVPSGDRYSGFSREFMRKKAREVGGTLVRMTLVRRVRVEPKPMRPERTAWGYADVKNTYVWHDAGGTREGAIQQGRELFGNQEFWIVSGYYPDPSSFFMDAEQFCQDACERASAENETVEDFPEVSNEACAELDTLLKRWIAKHVEPCNFWTADGEPELIRPEWSVCENGHSAANADGMNCGYCGKVMRMTDPLAQEET